MVIMFNYTGQGHVKKWSKGANILTVTFSDKVS